MSAKRKTKTNTRWSKWDRADRYVTRFFDRKWRYPSAYEAFVAGMDASQRSARAAGKKGRGK